MATWNGASDNNPAPGLSTIEEQQTESHMIESESTTGTSGISSTTFRPEDHLTVKQKWKIEREMHKASTIKHEPSRLLPVVKYLATAFFGLLLLACTLASKYSILKLTLKQSPTQLLSATARIDNNRRFIIIFFILLCPFVFNLLRSAWVGGLRRDMPWPNKRKILWAVVLSLLESCGLCLFVYKVFTHYSPIYSQLLLNAVYLGPVVINVSKCYHARNEMTFIKWLPYTIAAVSVVGGIILCILIIAVFNKDTKYIWHAIIAPITVGAAWSIQWLLFRSKETNNKRTTLPKYQSLSPTSINGNSTSGFVSEDGSSEEDVTEAKSTDQEQLTPRSSTNIFWKLGIISNFVKICFICLFSFLFYFVDNDLYPSNLYFTSTMYDEFVAAWSIRWNEDSMYLLINLVAPFLGYCVAFVACHVCMRRGSFALPLLLSVVLTPIVLIVPSSCQYLFPSTQMCSEDPSFLAEAATAVVLLTLCIVLTSIGLFNKETLVLDKESKLFWSPNFNGILLDQWLILNKRNKFILEDEILSHSRRANDKIYICTTMYHETSEEMRELLQSIHKVNISQQPGNRYFESHIIFDGGINNRTPSRYAYQLIILLYDTLGIRPEDGTKVLTPYGMKLSWRLPGGTGKQTMTFSLHLKDNLKVKNKKRWGQIMYMSYILDFLMEDAAPDDECFILTTDADIKFTPSSVEALMDLMVRDNSVGAVCARTYPMGSGPLVWYQVFDYAIGHWFQKTAEHVLGSVLCSPGCFSVYRCKAIKEVLPRYATTVEHADDFLIKDMGEDRWFCTLMVQCGWRIEYCAAAENSTNCPDEFEEFFKQRRRWIVSTIANLMLILKKWYLITRYNHRVSILFILYQGLLLMATLLGPSTVIIFVSGGLLYAWSITPIATILIQVAICISYITACLKAPQYVQILISKFLTFVYAVLMCGVAVGTVVKIVQDIHNSSEASSADAYYYLPVSLTTLYFGGLVCMFIVTALVHPTECLYLLHGIWYLLCLPAGYILLILYSVCNLTDRSWGTREEKVAVVVESSEPWYTTLGKCWRVLFFCCDKTNLDLIKHGTVSADTANSVANVIEDSAKSTVGSIQPAAKAPLSSVEEEDLSQEPSVLPVPVDDWLPSELKEDYVKIFQETGYENTVFISAMTKKDLEEVGVSVKSHVQCLLDLIKHLPSFEIEFHVPVSVKEWLEVIGLDMYTTNFRRCAIKKTSHLQVLKSYSESEIRDQLGITKLGHVKRLVYAISRLRNPTEVEKKVNEVKELIENAYIHHLKETNAGENAFWTTLIDHCLTPGGEAFSIEAELKDALEGLRSSWLMILAVSNTLWLILITSLASKIDLTVLGANPLSLAFVVIFSIIFLIQFLCMLVHRFQTVTHFLARATYKFGQPPRLNWMFQDNGTSRTQHMDPEDIEAIGSVRDARRRARIKQQHGKKQYKKDKLDETTPLMHHGND